MFYIGFHKEHLHSVRFDFVWGWGGSAWLTSKHAHTSILLVVISVLSWATGVTAEDYKKKKVWVNRRLHNQPNAAILLRSALSYRHDVVAFFRLRCPTMYSPTRWRCTDVFSKLQGWLCAMTSGNRHLARLFFQPSFTIINTSYQKLPFGSGVY